MSNRAMVILLFVPLALTAGDAPPSIRTAVQKAIGLLEKQSPQFIKNGGCNSCHAQFLPAAAQVLARQRGIPVGADLAQLPPEALEVTAERVYELSGATNANSLGYQLFAEAATKRPADERIEALVHYLKATQSADGRWQTAGNRPPLTYDDFTTTAFTIFALRAYAPDSDQSVGRALSWLLEASPQTTVERAAHLLGLGWAKASRPAIDKAMSGLLAQQRADGGWSQLPAMPSDAYGTGLALYALHEGGGTAVNHEAYRRGVQYLLRTQAADGSWHVKARSLPIQPYFESGFPYGEDQWISAAGTSWAAMALSLAVEPERAGL